MSRIFQLAGAIAVLLAACGQGPARPEVPKNLRAPAGEEVILTAQATGVQIYVCQAGPDQKFAWVLKAPEADLTDATGKKIAHHSAGPTWKHVDGSEVTGKVIARQDAPKPEAIPWLFSRVTSIQRIHTQGGLPPKANTCDASANGKESRSAYSADYYFYAPAR